METPIKYKKANLLISAKYSSTLIENKILAVALSDRQRMQEDAGGTIRVSIPASEIRKALGGNEGSFYKNLKGAAKRMNKRQIGIVDDETQQFAYFQLIQSCIYADGSLNITFNSDLAKYINIKDYSLITYTTLQLPSLLSFKKDAAFRLYEVIKSRCYTPSNESTKRTEWSFTYSLSELQFMIGCADASDEKAEEILNLSASPDFDKALELAELKNKSMIEWSSFRRNILVKAIEEINEKTEIELSFEPVKAGKGGRVISVNFFVKLKSNTPSVRQEMSKDDIIDDFYDKCSGLPYDLKMKDIRTIVAKANYDITLLDNAYQFVKTYKGHIDEPVGLFLYAIDNKIVPNVKDDYIKRNDYNFSELEEDLLKANTLK